MSETEREHSNFCQGDENGWCFNRNYEESHCKCPCHAENQKKRDLAELARLCAKYPEWNNQKGKD